jgi:two-component system, NtrC family, response regulator HydG
MSAPSFDENFLSGMSSLRKILFDAAVELGELRELALVRDSLFRLIFRITPATRAIIFVQNALLERNRDELESHAADWNDEIGRVMSDGRPIFFANESRSVLCIPLISAGDQMGAMYLESVDPEAPIDQMNLFLLMGVAPIAANAFRNCLYIQQLEDERGRLQDALDLRHDMVGNSNAIRKLKEQIAKAAPTNAAVLIEGESGTGKELVARAIHRNSARKAGPFLALNCAALPENLIESELFGHEKGSFTGAVAAKKGYFEAASGGTLFLDEIGDLPPVLQPKLFRALQEGEIQTLGGTRPVRINIRLITATNRDLEKAAAKKEFRPELFYRLNVASIRIPPLRQRADDIPALAFHFLEVFRKETGRSVRGISPEAIDILRNYQWPGNIRELQNIIQRAVVFGSGEWIVPDDLPENLLERGGTIPPYHEAVNVAKRDILSESLARNNGDLKKAAAELGLNFRSLYRLLDNFNLR